MKTHKQEQEYIINLIEKYLDNTISVEDHQILKDWIDTSKENLITFNHIRELILAHELNKNSLEIDEKKAFSRFKKQIQTEIKPLRKTFTLSYVAASVAAIVLISMSAIFSYVFLSSEKEHKTAIAPSFHEVVVPKGGRSCITLADGSKVYLNADTKLKYSDHFGVEDRNIWIEGEGYFVVSKSEIPFVVHCRDRYVTALGTEFNIKAYPEEDVLEMLLVKGKIAVNSISDEKEETILLPNQKLTIKEAPVSITESKTIKAKTKIRTIENTQVVDKSELKDVVTEISWKDNYLVINREYLSDLAVKLERKYDVSIAFADSLVGKIRYTGTLKDESIEQVLSAMSLVSDVNYSIDGKKITLKSKNKYN